MIFVMRFEEWMAQLFIVEQYRGRMAIPRSIPDAGR